MHLKGEICMYDYYNVGFDEMDILSGIINSLSTIMRAASLIIFIIGIIQCFFGYKWLRFVLAVSGFMTGAVIGSIMGLIGGLNSTDSISDVVNMIIVAMVIFGIIGAIISYKVYKLGIFLIGFSGVYLISLLTSLAGRLMSGNDSIAAAFATALIPAVVAGVLMVKFTKPLIIIYTGISGAYTAAVSLAVLMGGGTFFFTVALSIAGIYIQCKTNDGLTEKHESQYEDHHNPPPLKYEYSKSRNDNNSAFHYDYSNKSLNSQYDRMPPESVKVENNNDDIPKIID